MYHLTISSWNKTESRPSLSSWQFNKRTASFPICSVLRRLQLSLRENTIRWLHLSSSPFWAEVMRWSPSSMNLSLLWGNSKLIFGILMMNSLSDEKTENKKFDFFHRYFILSNFFCPRHLSQISNRLLLIWKLLKEIKK